MLFGVMLFGVVLCFDVESLECGHPVAELCIDCNNVGVLGEIRYIFTATFASVLKLAAIAGVDFNLIDHRTSTALDSNEILAFLQFEALVFAVVTLTTSSLETSAVSVIDVNSCQVGRDIEADFNDLRQFFIICVVIKMFEVVIDSITLICSKHIHKINFLLPVFHLACRSMIYFLLLLLFRFLMFFLRDGFLHYGIR